MVAGEYWDVTTGSPDGLSVSETVRQFQIGVEQRYFFNNKVILTPIIYISKIISEYTDKKEKKIFLIYKEIQNGAVAKSYMTNGLLIYG
jgi:hypothetical protein